VSTTPRPDERPADKPQASGSPFGKFMMSPVLVAVLLALTVSAVALAAGGVIVGGGGGGSDDAGGGGAASAPAPTTREDPGDGGDAGSSSDGSEDPVPVEPPADATPLQEQAYDECVTSRSSASCRPLLEDAADAELYFACRDAAATAVETCVRLASDPRAARAFRECFDAPFTERGVCLAQARRSRGGPSG
jgi:hypothetical protein